MNFVLKVVSQLFLAILFLTSMTAVCNAGSISLRTDSEAIRQSFLVQTPVGTSYDDVLRKLNEEGYKPIPNQRAGFLRQEKGQPPSTIGVSSIKANIGDYWTFPFLTTSVSAFWGFDPDQKLIDVWVWKTTDAP